MAKRILKMNDHSPTLPAPTLSDAKDEALRVSQLGDTTDCVVPPPDANWQKVHSIEMIVKTSTGNRWDRVIRIEEPFTEPAVFAIPKETFAENLIPEAIAEVQYSRNLGTSQEWSKVLKVTLEP
jgi:hypothetical protein